jgi:hypothetical protein
VLDLYAREWEGKPLNHDEFVISAEEKTSIHAGQSTLRIGAQRRLVPIQNRPQCAGVMSLRSKAPMASAVWSKVTGPLSFGNARWNAATYSGMDFSTLEYRLSGRHCHLDRIQQRIFRLLLYMWRPDVPELCRLSGGINRWRIAIATLALETWRCRLAVRSVTGELVA